jgi:WD40 repeat protein
MTARATRTKRIRAAAVAAVIVTLAAVAVAIGLSRQAAVASARRAEAAKLLALAQAQLADDPTEALALTTASLEVSDTPEARRFALRALWEAPPVVELTHGDSLVRPSFSPGAKLIAAGGNSSNVLVWFEDGSAPLILPDHEAVPYGPNHGQWVSDRLLVTGLVDMLAARVQVWSIPEGRRVRTIEFDGPSYWKVGKDVLFAATIERGTMAAPEMVLLRAWRLPEGQPEALGRVDWASLNASSFDFDLTGRALLYTQGPSLFARPLPSGGGGTDVLLARFAGDLSAVASTRPGQFFARERSGTMWQWSDTGAGLQRSAVRLPAPDARRAWPSPLGRWFVEGPLGSASARVWGVPSLPGTRPITLRRARNWYMATASAHPSDGWIAITSNNTNGLTFWPLTKPFVSVVDGYTGVRRPVAFSPDGRWLATSWGDRRVRLWPMPGNDAGDVELLALPPGTAETGGLAWDPEGRYLFATSVSGHASVLSLKGKAPRRLEGFKSGALLDALAVSPSGRRVAAAFKFGTGPREVRVWDLETAESQALRLPGADEALAAAVSSEDRGWIGGVSSLAFASDTVLYSAGWAGVLRWDIATGLHEVVAKHEGGGMTIMVVGQGGDVALTLEDPLAGLRCRGLMLRDLRRSGAEHLPEFGDCVTPGFDMDPTGSVVVAADSEGVIRVGRPGMGQPHLLFGHKGTIHVLAVSPDKRWIASSGEDNTLRLWPMPDLDKPPLHTLPHDALIAKLKSLTNLRAVRDPASATGWKIEVGPFPGWKTVPTW